MSATNQIITKIRGKRPKADAWKKIHDNIDQDELERMAVKPVKAKPSEEVEDIIEEVTPSNPKDAEAIIEDAPGLTKKPISKATKIGTGMIATGAAGSIASRKLGGEDTTLEAKAIPAPVAEEESEDSTTPNLKSVSISANPGPAKAPEIRYAQKSSEAALKELLKMAEPVSEVGETSVEYKSPEPIIVTDPATGEKIELTEQSVLQMQMNSANQIANEYKAEKDSLAKRELWETLVNAAGQMFAGLYGIKTGMDMSGTQFSKQDWAEKARMAKSEYDTDLTQSNNQLQMSRQALRDREDGAEKKFARDVTNMTLLGRAQDRALQQKNLLQDERKMVLSAVASDNAAALDQAKFTLSVRNFEAEDKYRQNKLRMEQGQAIKGLTEDQMKAAEKIAGKIDKGVVTYSSLMEKGKKDQAKLVLQQLRDQNAQYQAIAGESSYNFDNRMDAGWGIMPPTEEMPDADSILTPKADETKVVNGVTYRKTAKGWESVE